MSGTGRLRLTRWIGTAMLVATAALAGCGGAGSEATSDDAAPADGGNRQAAVAEAPGAAEKQAPGGSGAQAPVDLRVGQRSIVYTGSITVRVDDVDRAATRAVSIATAAGGFVGSDKRSSSGSDAEATVQLRVPADRFSGVVDELGKLGEQRHRDINTEDVTEESLDLDARIATQRARVASGRRLLAQAQSLSDLVMLEGEVAKREADLASLEAKKRRLDDLTALSTITVVLLGPAAERADDKEPDGFLAGLRTGWKGFLASLQLLITVAGVLLPWLIALGLPVYGLIRLRRRLRRNNPARPRNASIPWQAQPPVAPASTPAPAPAPAAGVSRPDGPGRADAE